MRIASFGLDPIEKTMKAISDVLGIEDYFEDDEDFEF